MTSAGSAPLHDELVLHPATRVLWRSPRSVQLELAGRGVVVDGADPATVRNLVRGRGTVARSARPIVDALHEAGFFVRAPAGDTRPSLPPRLASDIAALRVRRGDRAESAMAVRARAAVTVHGTTRVAALIAPLLAAAGVGRVHASTTGDARLAHAAPGGPTPADEGSRFSAAVHAAVRRAAPECDTGLLPFGVRPDVVVVAADGPADPEQSATLHLRGCAHLRVSAEADHGVVGPFVLPGLTSCLRCADRHRLDRDLAWSALAVQLAVPPRHGPPSDVALASLTAAVASLQVLQLLDGEEPTTLDATLEAQLPDWRLRRRTWPPHPTCNRGAGHRRGIVAAARGEPWSPAARARRPAQ